MFFKIEGKDKRGETIFITIVYESNLTQTIAAVLQRENVKTAMVTLATDKEFMRNQKKRRQQEQQ